MIFQCGSDRSLVRSRVPDITDPTYHFLPRLQPLMCYGYTYISGTCFCFCITYHYASSCTLYVGWLKVRTVASIDLSVSAVNKLYAWRHILVNYALLERRVNVMLWQIPSLAPFPFSLYLSWLDLAIETDFHKETYESSEIETNIQEVSSTFKARNKICLWSLPIQNDFVFLIVLMRFDLNSVTAQRCTWGLFGPREIWTLFRETEPFAELEKTFPFRGMRDGETFSFFPLIGPTRVFVPCFSSSQIREAGFSLLFLPRRFKHCFREFPEYFLSAKTRPQKMPLFFSGWCGQNRIVLFPLSSKRENGLGNLTAQMYSRPCQSLEIRLCRSWTAAQLFQGQNVLLRKKIKASVYSLEHLIPRRSYSRAMDWTI